MQLGTRWAVGASAPDRLGSAVVLAIRDAEAQLAEVDTASWRWTLTWLESLPVVQLDDGTTIRQGHDGVVTTSFED
ncbi:MAG: hypothetical protein ACOH1T_04470 [Microbacteriaceae bacterium]